MLFWWRAVHADLGLHSWKVLRQIPLKKSAVTLPQKKKNRHEFCGFRHFFFICDSLQEFQKKEKFIMLNMRIGNKNIVSGKYPILTVTVLSALKLYLWEVVWWTHSFLLWQLRVVKWLEEHFDVWESWLQFFAGFFVTQALLSSLSCKDIEIEDWGCLDPVVKETK